MKAIHKTRIRKWIAALRSGTYKQGMGQLKNGDAYCCLGVACDLYRKVTRKGRWEKDRCAETEAFRLGSKGHAFNLPGFVADWLFGKSLCHPIIMDIQFTYLNDTKCWNFTEIAAVIEDYLEKDTKS